MATYSTDSLTFTFAASPTAGFAILTTNCTGGSASFNTITTGSGGTTTVAKSVPNDPAGTVVCNLPISTIPITLQLFISNKSPTLAGILSNLKLSAEEDLLTAVSTNNTATWGLRQGAIGGSTLPVGYTGITSFANFFESAANLITLPTQIPTSVTNLSGMFIGCSDLVGANLVNWVTTNVTNMSAMFTNCPLFTANITNWVMGNVTDTSNMFNGATAFNAPIGGWDVSSVTNMTGMFQGATSFDQSIGDWDVSSVTNMTSMFQGATSFDQDISGWNVLAAAIFVSMFEGATSFNKDISNWNVVNATDMTSMFENATIFAAPVKYWPQPASSSCVFNDMFTGATAFNIDYFPSTTKDTPPNAGYTTLGTPLRSYFGQVRPERYPCFMRGTQILCYRAEEEVYLPIEDLRKGDLVKTFRNGYLPIHMIGTSSLSNPGDDERTTGRLYKCSKELYPGLFDDLYITGCHSILVPALTEDQWENTKDMLGDVYITDNHFRLMACLDEKAQPFQKNAFIDIFHIALENEDYYMNYGVYANGLLVETCSKRYLTELSNMRIIGEETACCDPETNVFSMMGSSIPIC